MSDQSRIIFDTSAINKLYADTDYAALVAGLKTGYFVRITETNAAEIMATGDQSLRQRLWRVLAVLSTAGECIIPYQMILERGIKTFHSDSESFDWRKVPIRFPQLEVEIVRQKVVTDKLAETQNQQANTLETEFERIYTEMRPAFDAVLQNMNEQRPSIHSFVERGLTTGGALLAYGELLYSNVVPTPTEDAIRALYSAFPSFRSMVIALFVAHYDRCVRDPKHPSLRAKRVDMMMAAYLPYSDVFVSNDAKQLRALKVVAKESDLSTRVLSYREFRDRITSFDG